MKTLMMSLLALGLCSGAQAHGSNEFYANGPASLIPAQNGSLNSLIWVGGDIAELLFDSMTEAPSKRDSSEGVEVRFGKSVRCLHNSKNTEITYSCAMEIEVVSGAIVDQHLKQ